MRPRKNIPDQFTTFLSISEDSFISEDGNRRVTYSDSWKKSAELFRNFEKNCSQEYSEEFLVLDFLNQTKSDNLNPRAPKHLAAYLQETAYWVAKKEYKKFLDTTMFLLNDCFQEAQKCIHDPQQFKKILNKFDPKRGSSKVPLSVKLKNFLGQKMADRVFLFLRVNEAKYSNAGLLKYTSKSYLKESLQESGIYEFQLRSLTETSLKQALERVDIQQPKLSQCLLVWTCFMEIDTSPDAANTKIKELTSKQLKAITNRYKELAPSQELSASVSSEYLQKLLQTCDDSARSNTKFFQCNLACLCYKQIYVPNGLRQRLEWPNQEKLEEITNRYNQLFFSLRFAINSRELDSLLKTCVKVLRAHIKIKISPPYVDSGYTNPDGEEVEVLENLSPENLLRPDKNEVSLPPLEKEIKIEHDEQLKKIKPIVIDSYSKLPKDQQKILLLELGLSIIQADIAYALGLNPIRGQCKVSRDLRKAKRDILKGVVEEVESDLQKFNSIISDSSKKLTPKDVENISTTVIDDYLKLYLTSRFSEMLNIYFSAKDSNILQIFKHHYGEEIPLSNVAEEEIINRVKQQLCLKLSEEVQKDLPKPLNERESANQKILTFVDEWLKNAPYATFKN